MTKKHFYVPWEAYPDGRPSKSERLDSLCLQGPHTLERAIELRDEMHAHGVMASVIDCSNSLKYVDFTAQLLQKLKEVVSSIECGCEETSEGKFQCELCSAELLIHKIERECKE